jgi:hypothetical protein
VSAGALFTHWIADSLTLWKSPVTDQNLWIAAAYYSIIARAPPQIFWALSAVVTLGGTTLLWSLNDFRAGNIMFDGGSIFLFGTVVAIYLTTIFPNIATFFSVLPPHALTDPVTRTMRNATLELASNNLVCSVALTGVLALQAGRYWAETADADDEEEEEIVAVDAPAAAPEAAAASTSATPAPKTRKTAAAGHHTPEISISEEKVIPLLQQRLQTA